MIASLLSGYQLQYRGDENIPSIVCPSLRDFTILVERLETEGIGQLVFRGQRRADWNLSPSLARFSTTGVVEQEVADEQISLFRKAIRGRVADHALMMDDDSVQTEELWSVGQHHGLHTPLLDWTMSPYVALFFAFEKKDRSNEADNPHRAVYVLNKTKVESLVGAEAGAVLRFIEPRKDDHGRLVSQAGLFTWSKFGQTLENALLNSLREELEGVQDAEEEGVVAQYLLKILFKNESQPEILRTLRQMNIHPASLFPDLIGASLNCNRLVEEKFGRVQPILSFEADPVSTEPSPTVDRDEVPIPGEIVPVGIWKVLDRVEFVRLLASLGIPGESYGSLADEVIRELDPHFKQVDWDRRESAIARMRNVAKVVLRRNEYPEARRDEVVARLFQESTPQGNP